MKDINVGNNDSSNVSFGIFGTDTNVSANKILVELPAFSNIESKVVSLDDLLWDYAIELTTDDFVVGHWEDYKFAIDEICRGFIRDIDYLEANVFPIMSYDNDDQLVRILILIGHKHISRDADSIESHRCLNLKFHRHFCSEKSNYTYKHYANEDPKYIAVNDVAGIVDAFRHDGEIYYLPERMQLPFLEAIDLARFRLQVCSVQ